MTLFGYIRGYQCVLNSQGVLLRKSIPGPFASVSINMFIKVKKTLINVIRKES